MKISHMLRQNKWPCQQETALLLCLTCEAWATRRSRRSAVKASGQCCCDVSGNVNNLTCGVCNLQEIGVKTPVAPASPPAPSSPRRAAPGPSRLGQAASSSDSGPAASDAAAPPPAEPAGEAGDEAGAEACAEAPAGEGLGNPEHESDKDGGASEGDGSEDGEQEECLGEGEEGGAEGGGPRVRHECAVCGITTTSAAHLEVLAQQAALPAVGSKL